MDLFGRPIIENPGKPFLKTFTSTSIGVGSSPKCAAEKILVSTDLNYNQFEVVKQSPL